MGEVIQTLRRKLDSFATSFTVNVEGVKNDGHVITS